MFAALVLRNMISKEDIKKLSELSRIEITEHESEKVTEDLQAILGYVDMLKEVDVSHVQETPHVSYVLNAVREDNMEKKNKNEIAREAAELLEAAPEKEDGYVKVRSILGKES